MLIIAAVAYLYVGLSHYLLAIVTDGETGSRPPAVLVVSWPVCIPVLLYSLRREFHDRGSADQFPAFLRWIFFGGDR